MKSVAIVLLNWNGWLDTVACLDSLRKSTSKDFQVVVCDNASTDGSISEIEDWLVNESVSYYRGKSSNMSCADLAALSAVEVILIENERNGGFAYGNNSGLRYFLSQPDFKYVWLLNNDTLVSPTCLESLVEKMETDTTVGICGAKLIYHHNRDRVQAAGGAIFSRVRGGSVHVGADCSSKDDFDVSLVEQKIDYVVGASMFVRRAYVEKIGLMSEDYFLYYEEIDWSTRGRYFFRLGYCDSAVVYHKEGGSIGSSRNKKQRSTLSQFYLVRSRLIFTRKHFSMFLPTVWMFSFLQGVKEAIAGNSGLSRQIFRALFGARTYRA